MIVVADDFTWPATAAGSSVQLLTGSALITGFAFKDTAGVIGAFDLVDGDTDTAPVIIPIRFGINESGRDFTNYPIAVTAGIRVVVTVGTCAGAVFAIPTETAFRAGDMILYPVGVAGDLRFSRLTEIGRR